MSFLADRQIDTRLGVLDVAVQLREDGRCVARLVGHHPEPAAIGGAIGDSEDAAVARLAAMVDDCQVDEAEAEVRAGMWARIEAALDSRDDV